jgi:hypothetical protein
MPREDRHLAAVGAAAIIGADETTRDLQTTEKGGST